MGGRKDDFDVPAAGKAEAAAGADRLVQCLEAWTGRGDWCFAAQVPSAPAAVQTATHGSAPVLGRPAPAGCSVGPFTASPADVSSTPASRAGPCGFRSSCIPAG